MSLAEKIRKSRESQVPVGGFNFTIQRPTALDMAEMRQKTRGRAVLPYIVGWDKSVTSLAMGLPGGDAHPAEFDADLRDEWLSDRIDLLKVLADAVFDAYAVYAAGQEAAKKN